MRKLYLILIAFIVNMPFNSYSYEHDVISVSLAQSDNEYREKPEKGHRMPPNPETCVIDFESLTIKTSVSDYFISYELWDETDNSLTATYSMDYDMVVYMSSLTGCYQLRLVTAESTYIGYIEL